MVKVSPVADASAAFLASSSGYADRTRAFLKIQDGCDYTCSFCTIPLARGESRSVDRKEVLREARALVGQGYREIVLTGVNVGDYGRKDRTSLLELLKALEEIPSLDRIRISSVEPNLLTDELLEFWVQSGKMCRHFHLPLQSGSDAILRLMQRRYLSSWYADRLSAITSAIPGAGIGADVIVGFPGETDRLFEETYAFLVEQPLTYLHVFTYSERPNTTAASSGKRVRPEERAERSERLRTLSVRKQRLFHASLVGKTVSVLFEEPGTTESGLSSEYVRVSVESERRLTNQMLSVRITGVQDDGCRGMLDPVGNVQSARFAEHAA
jgi:threonylcarbamoyladenosine tRNA methylthiotransferase MtaB